MLDKLCLVLSRYRMTVLVVILIITGIFGYGMSKIRGEVIIQEMFPYDHPFLKLIDRFGEVFGTGGSGVVIAVEAKNADIFNSSTLTTIKNINDEVELWDEVYRVLTISIASNSTKVSKALPQGEIRIEALMFPNVPQDEREMTALKKNIFSNPSYNGVLVAEDGTAAIVLTEMKENVSYEAIFGKLKGLKEKYSDANTDIHIVGFPMLMGWVYSLKSQMFFVFGVSGLAIAVVLILIFRNFSGMFSPLVNAFILTIWGLGFVGFTGVNFNPLLYVLAFLVGARMIGNSHQIAYRYFEELDSSNGDRTIACYETMRTMWIPNFAAVAADVAGFTVLIIAKIVLMQHLALIMSFWMATILLTGFLVPVVCSIFPFKVDTSEWNKDTCQNDWVARGMMKFTKFSIAPRTKWITIGLILILGGFCINEMFKLKIGDPTPGSPLFYQNHPYNKDQAFINEKFNASSENLVLFYEGKPGSVYDPVVLQTFEQFAIYMSKELPDIYKTSSSVSDIGKMVNLTQHDGDPTWYQIPRNQEHLSGLLGYLRTQIGTASLRRFIDGTLERAQITIYFADHTSDNLLRIRDTAYRFFKERSFQTQNGEFKLAGGRIGMEIAINEEMKRAHFLIDAAVYAAIFLLCALCYKSIVAGLMLTVPLLLANAMSFAFMSIRDIGLSINTLPVAAIGAGLGVDFAIYLYSRAMEEFPLEKGDWENTITQIVCTCGKAVVYTGVTVVLPIITWWFFSDMKFQAEVGFFLSLIMCANVLLALTLHPLMIYIIKPKFISRNYTKTLDRDKGGDARTLPDGSLQMNS
jgi:predicted RND superfamily exporter protein